MHDLHGQIISQDTAQSLLLKIQGRKMIYGPLMKSRADTPPHSA